jgi:hypothetical protein
MDSIARVSWMMSDKSILSLLKLALDSSAEVDMGVGCVRLGQLGVCRINKLSTFLSIPGTAV